MEHTCAGHNDPQYYLMSLLSECNDPSLFTRIHPFSGQLSFFVLHEALPDYLCSGTLLCPTLSFCTPYNLLQHRLYIFSDWSLSFSFIFSTTQLTMLKNHYNVFLDIKTVPSSVKEQAGSQVAHSHRLTDKPAESHWRARGPIQLALRDYKSFFQVYKHGQRYGFLL